MQAWLGRLREQTLAVRVAVLAAALIAVYLSAILPAWHFAGPNALAAATLAGLACLVGFALALAAGEPYRATDRILHGMFWAMAFRMGVPLAAALVVHFHAGDLAGAGFFGWLVGFFEVGLAVEVFLSLPPAHCGNKTSGGSPDAVS
jgi:hypothetical protein